MAFIEEVAGEPDRDGDVRLTVPVYMEGDISVYVKMEDFRKIAQAFGFQFAVIEASK